MKIHMLNILDEYLIYLFVYLIFRFDKVLQINSIIEFVYFHFYIEKQIFKFGFFYTN